jgi:phosphopantetheinyl transferase (holo-ACP synthase)
MDAPELAPLLGNDVVDLGDPETRAENLHPRFDGRVFTDLERRRLATAADSHALRWSHWALKEATYKAARRGDAAAIFSPRQVRVTEFSPETGEAVIYAFDRKFHGRVQRDGRLVHAVVAVEIDRARIAFAAREEAVAPADASAAVRAFTRSALAGLLRCDPRRLSIGRQRKVPVLLRDGEPLSRLLSLSHHGRTLAFAVSPELGTVAT